MPRKKLPPVETPYVNGVPLCLAMSRHIPATAIRIYIALLYRMDKKSRRCWASEEKLGATVGITEPKTIWTALRVLETLRLIKRVQERPGTTTIYKVVRPKRKHEELIRSLRSSVSVAVKNADDPRTIVKAETAILHPPKMTANQRRRAKIKRAKEALEQSDIRNSGEYKERQYRDLEGIPDDE